MLFHARWARRVALTVASLWLSGVAWAAPSEPGAPRCSGEYADDLQVLAPHAPEYERQPYSYCVRNTATLRVPLLRRRRQPAQHPQARGGARHRVRLRELPATDETLLLTNQHVAEWPAVTDEEHPVDGVPTRLQERLRHAARSSTTRTTPTTATTSRSPAWSPIRSSTWRCSRRTRSCRSCPGRSAARPALKERNVVEVRGFPLGAFQATNVGKVVSALRPRRLQRVGPRRLRGRRAAVVGQLRLAGARGLLPDRRVRAGRRLPRRLLRGLGAQRGGRHRSGARSDDHAQALAARPRRRGRRSTRASARAARATCTAADEPFFPFGAAHRRGARRARTARCCSR